MKVNELIKVWSMPDRSAERVQLTVRLPYPDYARLHALKEVYQGRSVNDLVSDLLRVGLDAVVEELPAYVMGEEQAKAVAVCAEHYEELVGSQYGPRTDFDSALRKILEQKSADSVQEVAA